MKTELLRRVALACFFLLTAPLSSSAQSDNNTIATESRNAATLDSSNVAARSLQRALAEATTALAWPSPFTPGNELKDEAYSPAQSQGNTQDQKKAPTANPQAPSLPDLFPPSQTQGSAREQALLDKRSHMLKIHQRLGLITIAPLLATVISSGGAASKHSGTADLNWHAALGGVTAGMYFSTAYFAIFAPKIPGTTTRGPIRLHRDLAWVHGPGMILTAVLGGLAYEQKSRGEKVHGIASAHGPVGWVTVGAFAAAVLSVSIKL
jgi:hypothetical protein